METKKWYKKDSFWSVIFIIGLMWVHLFIRDTSFDGAFPAVWIGFLISRLIRKATKNTKEKEGIIFSTMMIGNYILFRYGIYIPNYILVFSGFSWIIINAFNKENVTYKLQKKILIIILLIGFFSVDYYMYANNIIKDKNFYRYVKKEYNIKGKVEEEDLKGIGKLGLDDDDRINNLDGIENFKDVEYIYISDGFIIHDFRPIGKLSNLKHLLVWYANVDKLEKIDNMESLERLEILYPKGGKIDSLDNFPNLKRFDVQGMDFEDLIGLEGPANLERLNIADGKVISFDGIEKFPQLKELDFYEL
ncbi:hypothetical protein [Crassaminicella profunda]|uniref:hypothetical protein n=1 Tax=Crassaminicella profunda TaxID=1286698 RepID=UPI001CA6B315|nr:hypothetical protein [Crassaminicella profunda]QZY53900.1 hypothetical protein K7H06_12645 [Crassaminicella profunda]